MKKLLLSSLFILSITACKKDPVKSTPDPAPTTGSLNIEFQPLVNDSALVYSTKWYKNFNSDSFKVDIFRYYISNIVLTNLDNGTYAVPNSYFKIDHNISGKNVIALSSIPAANYKAIQFMIGVDSTHNVSGAQDGDLAASDMFWNWNTGYIMAKFEGTSPQSTASGRSVAFHIGGFKVPYSANRVVNLSFGSSTANVSGGVTPQVHLKSDLGKWFHGNGGTINFNLLNGILTAGVNAQKIANNYAQSISFDHLHN